MQPINMIYLIGFISETRSSKKKKKKKEKKITYPESWYNNI